MVQDVRPQVEPDPVEMVARYGADTSVLDWRGRLVCSECGSRRVDIVVTGTERQRCLCEIHLTGIVIVDPCVQTA